MKGAAVALRFVREEGPKRAPRRDTPTLRIVRKVALRAAAAADVPAIHALIAAHVAEGHLLPRTHADIEARASRFIVATAGGRLVGCAELAPLSRTVAEVRSLVVADSARALGVGRRLIGELTSRAVEAGFDRLCAFTHSAGYFTRLGFSIVPHAWLAEKIETDCRTCAQFRHCGQYAVLLPLARTAQACVPLAALHG